MRYRNPELPVLETPKDESREFLILMGAVTAIVAALMGAALLLAGWLAPMIPFSAEKSLGAGAAQSFATDKPLSAEQQAIQRELEALVGRVAGVMELPAEMTITVHYVDTPTVNAMATLGGHLFVFRGLIEKLESEEALAAVIAHEIGHVRERHVIRAMGRGVAIVGALNAVGIKSRGLSQWAMGQGGQMAALSFSREAEREADRASLDASYRLYGHAGGVMALFDFFAKNSEGGLEIMKTHPLPEHRRQELRQLAQAQGYPLEGESLPLAPPLAALAAGDSPQTP